MVSHHLQLNIWFVYNHKQKEADKKSPINLLIEALFNKMGNVNFGLYNKKVGLE